MIHQGELICSGLVVKFITKVTHGIHRNFLFGFNQYSVINNVAFRLGCIYVSKEFRIKNLDLDLANIVRYHLGLSLFM